MSQQLNLDIGGQRLHFRGQQGLRMQAPRWDYPGFLSTDSCPPRPGDIDILVSLGKPPEARPMATCFDTGDAWRMSARGDRRRIEMIPRQGNGTTEPHWCAETNTHYEQVQLYCADTLLDPDSDRPRICHLVQYPLDQILLVQHLLSAQKGLLLHAAGAVMETGRHPQGILFAGISGAGKSTLTKQLMNRSGWRFFSDDRIVVRLHSDRVQMYGTPWPGDAHVARNECAPLNALCFLCQSDRTALEAISNATALARLLPVASIPWYDRALLSNALDLCARLLANVPVYELHFQRQDVQLANLLEALRQ